MKEFPDVIAWSIPAFLLLIALERVSYLLHRDDDERGYSAADTATSLTMGLGSVGTDLLWKIPITAAYAVLYALTPLRVAEVWWTWPLVLIAQDFCYYWSHRGHHVVRILWATHVVHHSSERFNLSTALRQPWTSVAGWLFYVPLVLAGVHPAVVAFCGSVNLLYQFWIHTERIDRMPRWFEAVFNTPSHHRVHHASQGGYLDRNFGGILIVWDRLFGSFAPERERCVYGLTTNIATHNPLRVAFHEYVAIARDIRAAASWRHRAGHLLRSPGWRPDPADGSRSGHRLRPDRRPPASPVRAGGPARRAGRTSAGPGSS
jgi:sterol desaturase/sphingolipid hydroxylase (fatty acid hydroxylase superfamily)